MYQSRSLSGLLGVVSGIFLSLASLTGALMAGDAELRGRVMDAASEIGLPEALVKLVPTATGGGPAIEATADLFGRFEFAAVPPDAYTLEASFPGYVPFSEGRSYSPDELAAEEIPLTPVIPGGGPDGTGISNSIEIQIQTRDASSQAVLADVPFRIRRYSLGDPGVLLETITGFTDAEGQKSLRGNPKGYYDFRFNNPADGAILSFYDEIEVSLKGKVKLESSHSAIANLNPIKSAVTITALGVDPSDPDAGETALEDVFIELQAVSPGLALPPGFDPMTGDPRDFADELLPPMGHRTGPGGTASFDLLPPLDYIVTARKPGYLRSHAVLSPGPAGALPAAFDIPLPLDDRTGLKVFLQAPYLSHDVLGGLAVALEGIEGTATDGFERIMPADPFLGETGPGGEALLMAEFTGILPGRYRASVEGLASSPARPALEDAVAAIGIRFRGEKYFEVAQAVENEETVVIDPVPATIRGRLFVAEEREALDLPDAGLPVPFNRWQGPAYRLKPQTGIEFTESAVSLYLHPSLSIVSIDADVDGSFSATVLPGFWGINIPSMDGYFGSNYRSRNLATSEEIELGWPYSTDPAAGLPEHPFGSGPIPISSGDELEMDLFVRKQVYYLNGTVASSLGESPSESRPLAPGGLSVPFSHLAAKDEGGGSLGEVSFDENGSGSPPGPVTVPLIPGESVDGAGTRTPAAGASFLVAAPRGSHTLTVTHPHFSFSPSGTAGFALPDYEAPGSPLAGAPIPMEDVWEDLPGVPDPFTADYEGEHTLTIEFYGKSEGGARELRPGLTRDKPEWFYHGGLGDRVFLVDAGAPWTMSDGAGWEIWASSGGNWYHASFDLSGGPSNKVVEFDLIEEWGGSSSPPPVPSYTLNLEAINHHNPDQEIDGLTASFPGGLSLTTGGTDTTGSHTDSYLPDEITTLPPGWLMAFGGTSPPTACDVEVDPSGLAADVTVTARLARGSLVKGTVVVKDAIPRTVIPGVPVVIRNRFGLELAAVTTNTSGYFETTLPRSETLFVDIQLAGYKPYRARKAPNLDVDPTPGDSLHDYDLGDIPADPLPKPAFLPPGGSGSLSNSFDRAGMFLPGVRKSSDAPHGEDAPAVMMTYTLEVEAPAEYSLGTLPAFDTSSGGGGHTVGGPGAMVEDAVRAIWIIDPRSFPGNPTEGGEDSFTLPAMTDPLYAGKVHAKLRELAGALPPAGPVIDPAKNIFVLKITDLDEMEVSGVTHFKTKPDPKPIDLASLPPGLFQPYVIAETERGTFAHFQLKYEGTDPAYKNLFGMKLPPWLAFIADTAATIGAIKDAGEASPVKMGDIFPVDLIELLPDVTGFIGVNDGEMLPGPPPFTEPDDETLYYVYDLKANFAEGSPIPGSGLLGFAPGFAGLDAEGELSLEVNGSVFGPDAAEAGKPTLKVTGGASLVADTGDFFDPSSYLPKAIPKTVRKTITNEVKDLGTLKATLTGEVNVQSVDSLVIPFSNGAEVSTAQRVIDFSAFGGVELFAKAGVAPFAEKAPYVGPFIRATRRFLKGRGQDFDIILDTTTRAGAALERKLTTRYTVPDAETPEGFQDEAGNAYPARRNVLSADFRPLKPQTTTEGAQRLCLGYKPGLTLEAGKSQLRVELEVAGDQCTAPRLKKPFKALSLELNKLGDWPPVKRVSGELTGTISGKIDAGFFGEASASWTWGKMTIDVPFNTEESLHLDPFSFTASESGLDDVSLSTMWCGAGFLLADHFYDGGDFRLASGPSSDALVYTGVDAGTGLMSVEVALRTGPATWAAPVTTATAEGVLEVAAHELPAGAGWIIVWAEVDAAGLEEFSPPATLKWKSYTADLTSVTASGTIAARPGTAFDLCLVPMPSGTVGLFWLETLRGPGSVIVDINGATFASGTWSGVTTLYDESVIYGWDVAGPGFTGAEPAQILAYTATATAGDLVIGSWDGASAAATPATLDPGLLGERVRIAAGPVDTFLAAYPLDGAGIGLATKTGAGPWTILPSPVPGVTPADLAITAVDDGVATHYFLAWTGNGDIGFAYLDATGALLGSPGTIQQGAPGDYSAPAALPVAGAHSAVLVVKYDNGADVGLRAFPTTEGGGLSALDSDGDTLPDLDELAVIDADPDDSIKKPADVLAAADFDGDGSSNGAESAAGTDAADPGNFPGQTVGIVTGIHYAEEFGGARGLFYVTRTGDFSAPVTVSYSVSGSATEGTDFASLAGSITIAAETGNEPLPVEPLADLLAEGDETVVVTLTASPAYTIGPDSSATVTIVDIPFDAWRAARFTPSQASADEASGFTLDFDNDRLTTLLEYGFFAEPFLNGLANRPSLEVATDTMTGESRGELTYTRRKDSLELIYAAEVSTGLKTWTPAGPGEVAEVSVVDNGDGSETVTLRDVNPLGALPKRFLRITITRITN